MKRRDLIAMISGAAASPLLWPLAGRAQQAMPVVGVLSPRSAAIDEPLMAVFRRGLAELGFVEGRNVIIDYRPADGNYERLPALAADLARRNVAVIVTYGGNRSVPIVKAVARTIPIVFVMSEDPVKLGFVPSLSRPAGNITGVTTSFNEAAPKRLSLLLDLVPGATDIGHLINPALRIEGDYSEPEAVQTAARALGRRVVRLDASSLTEIEAAFARAASAPLQAILVASDPFFFTNARAMIEVAARRAIPTLYFRREFAAAGGLMSYASNPDESYRQVGIYAARILKGEKPADLPVMQPTKFEFVLNLNTARTLGLSFPTGLLSFADEVIE